MKQFNLEEWLQDKSRKVVTRDGRPVRIVCTDSPILHHPIVGFVECDLFTWTDDGKVIYGGKCEDKNDLFFADEEEELTEFERRIYQLINYTDVDNFPSIQEVKEEAEILLDLARKELEQSNVIVDKDKYIKNCDYYYEQGKADALKSLPKWKKANVFVSNEFGLATRDGDLIITHNGYQIKLSDLETLPTEE